MDLGLFPASDGESGKTLVLKEKTQERGAWWSRERLGQVGPFGGCSDHPGIGK